ncbi:MAG: biopolymer transporter ExbD [bacterium]
MNFRAKYKPETLSFQVVPMIDILFLLLCFFVTSQIYTQWEAEIDVTLPTASTAQMEQRLPGEIIMNLLKDGTVIVNGRQLNDAELAVLLGRLVELFPGQPVLIRADKQTAYEHVIKVLDQCRQADIWNISFAAGLAEKAPGP